MSQDHGSSLSGSTLSGSDLKRRIQGFGSGPEPPPLPTTFWGAVFGDDEGPSVTDWFEDAVKGLDTVLSDIAEEIMGEPTPPPSANSGAHRGDTNIRTRAESEKFKLASPERESQPRRLEGPDETSDSPGQYRIQGKETFLSNSVLLGGDVVKKLDNGEEVSVEEVVIRREERRVRGRVRHPAGWISLYNMDNGYRWAARLGPLEKEQEVLEASSGSACQELVPEKEETANKDVPLLCFDDELLIGTASEEEEEEACSSQPTSCQQPAASPAVSSAACRSTECSKEFRASSTLKVGDRVLRKGQDAIIISIDQTLDPPSCTVRMCEDGREVGCELDMLQEAPSSSSSSTAPKQAAATEVADAKSRVDLLDIGESDSDGDQPPEKESVETCKPEDPSNAPTARLPLPGGSVPLLPPPPGMAFASTSTSGDLLGFDPDSSAEPKTSSASSTSTGFKPFGLAPIDEFQEEPMGSAQGLPRGISIFDPTLRDSSGYPGATHSNEISPKTIAEPPKAFGGFNVPRGVSIFDPLDTKNFDCV